VVETSVRMGKYAVSGARGDVLTSTALGSCIGLALIDRLRAVAGLAHIVLPACAAGRELPPEDEARYADQAVPILLDRVICLGGRHHRLEAVLVGGAAMFSIEARIGHDIGHRNEVATRDALDRAGIPVRAAETGGCKGRTVRVFVGSGAVTVKEAGGQELYLLPPADGRAQPSGLAPDRPPRTSAPDPAGAFTKEHG
jgi:chemotaxis protein CheD